MRSPVLWVLLFAACAGADEKTDTDDTDVSLTDADTDECGDLTWDTVGAPFTTTWCAPCHSVDLTGDDRQDAPEAVNLDTYESVLALANSVRDVAGGEDPIMPPGGGPTAQDRSRLVAWLDCETR